MSRDFDRLLIPDDNRRFGHVPGGPVGQTESLDGHIFLQRAPLSMPVSIPNPFQYDRLKGYRVWVLTVLPRTGIAGIVASE
jgi:hypothetical protein